MPPKRGSQRWSFGRLVLHETIGARITTAILLPVPVAFYSLSLAVLLAVPCWYFAWTQVQQWRQAINRENDPEA